jgi:hypothetical protein
MESRSGMTATSRVPAGSWPADSAGGADAVALREAAAIAREWAGDALVALLLSGSHATGEAVWLEAGGRTVTLSDLDFYAVLEDEASCRAAAARARRERPAAIARLRAGGVEAPLEVGFLTPAGLARMAARPGTIELARHGRVMAGDAAVLARVPRYSPKDIPAEETALLLENRGFELLLAWPSLSSQDPLERAAARHGTLKAAADLATVLSLQAGELPDGTAARVRLARERATALEPSSAGHTGIAAELDALWSACVAWRSGSAAPPEPGAAVAEWRSAVRCWCATWTSVFAGRERDAWDRAVRSAARAPLPRRIRQYLRASGASGAGTLVRQIRLALAGTPQHRVNASAAVLLLAAAEAASTSAPALPAGALRALRVLGVSDANAWDEARRDVLRAWDEIVLGGQRGAALR